MGHVRTVANGDVVFCATHIVMMASHGCFAHFAGNGGPHRSVGSDRIPQMEIGTMSAKFLPAIVAGLLLGTTALASAQTLVYPQYRYNYGYNGYTPVYPPAVTFGFGVAPGAYYAPGYYNYAPAYVAPGYNGWNEAGWNHW